MALDLDVVVDMYARDTPLGEHVAFGRQRLHGRSVQRLKQSAP
jgi:hypothetical protein